MELKSRQISLLRNLARSVEGIAIQELMAEHDVSRRTVYYDVQRVNEWLAGNGLGQVQISSKVLVGSDVDWGGALRLMGMSRAQVLDASERQAMAFLHAALSTERVSIASLMETYGVSRNTVISDIRELKREIEPLGIGLVSTQGQGYAVVGNELSVRKFLWVELQRLSAGECMGSVVRFLQRTLVGVTKNDIDYHELCRSLIKQYESDLKTRCFLDSNGLEGMMIQVAWLRGLLGCWVTMGREEQVTLMGTVSYRSVQCSVEKLKAAGIFLPSEEILYITSLLLGIKTTDFARQREEDEYVSGLAERLVANFERVGCLTFMNKDFVHEQLSHHIRPLYYRQKYGIPVHNPLKNDVQKMYPMAFEFVRRAAVESGMEQLSDDELAYLTIYLSSDLDSKMLEDGDTSASKVLVVGATNMSTVTLVKEQLFEACGICFEYEYAEPEKLHRWALESYALVVTLTHLPAELRSSNTVEVTPFLSEEAKREIYNILKSNRVISRYNALIDGIVDIVGENIPAGSQEWLHSDKLHFELFRFFDENDRGIMGPASVQLGDSHINTEKTVLEGGATWQDAVLAGAQELQGGAGRSRLVERMRNIMLGNRCLYYRMAPDAVVVRCPMQGDENAHIEARIVVSPDGVVFPDGAAAHVVICVSTINRYSHWGTLYDIYQYFSDPENVEALKRTCVGAPAEGGR